VRALISARSAKVNPLQNAAFSDFVLSQYGFAFFLALAAVLFILARPLYRSDDANHTIYGIVALAVVGSVYAVPQLYGAIGGVVGLDWQVVGLIIAAAFLVGATFLVEYDTEELYFVVWAVFIGSAAFTQTRFNYYLAVIVAVGSTYFLQVAFDAISLRSLDDLRDVEGWQAMAAIALVVVLIVPLVAMATPVWAAGANTGPGSVVQWDDSLQWMNDETPQPGELEGADNPMELYGTYERPADGDYDPRAPMACSRGGTTATGSPLARNASRTPTRSSRTRAPRQITSSRRVRGRPRRCSQARATRGRTPAT